MQRITYGGLAYYQFDSLMDSELKHGIFTRLGGVSTGCYHALNLSQSTGDTAEAVAENRRRMYAALSIPSERVVTSWLVHGNAVRRVDETDLDQNDVRADAIITNRRGLALTLRFADCLPVLFYDPRRAAIGIVHAGWLGIECGVLPATVRALREAYGCDPRDIRACVGPSIGPDKFEVGADVAARIQSAVSEPVVLVGNSAARAVPGGTDNDKPHVDLWKAARSQLCEAGVREIEIAGLCTASNTHEWFSHRAEKGATGRFGALIMLTD
ncbi:MAG: peptidoglycan editing factor PgeF [Anaerolineae bacterium]|nr:peptidoglycan editing factor PgeF [Thermoflexales bacterium]MDW8408847.1 peptidoglycan editing factor PgeF [Anaerolineae bacterium]